MREALKFEVSLQSLILTGLIVLLVMQLTGLTCLNDFKFGSVPPTSLVSDREDIEPNADRCPCHLYFQSVPFWGLSHWSVLSNVNPPGPASYSPTFVEPLLHPPPGL